MTKLCRIASRRMYRKASGVPAVEQHAELFGMLSMRLARQRLREQVCRVQRRRRTREAEALNLEDVAKACHRDALVLPQVPQLS